MRWFLALLSTLALWCGPALADYEAGRAAYERGDYPTALREWRALARQGDGEALFALGLLWERGEGVTGMPSYARAYSYFERAADLGLVEATVFVANRYLWGRGVDKDVAKAFDIVFRLWRERGARPAFDWLRWRYVFADRRRRAEIAEMVFADAVEGDGGSRTWLAHWYYRDIGGRRRDPVKAVAWSHLAAPGDATFGRRLIEAMKRKVRRDFPEAKAAAIIAAGEALAEAWAKGAPGRLGDLGGE